MTLLFDSAKSTKFLENFDQKLLCFDPSDCVNDVVNPLINLLKQTIDEETKNCGIKNEHKNCSWPDSSIEHLLKKGNSLFCELIVPPVELILNKSKTLRNKVLYNFPLMKGLLHLQTVSQNLLKNELLSKHLSKLSRRKQSTASAILKNTSSVLIVNEKG